MARRSLGRIRDIPSRIDRSGKIPTGVEGSNVPTDFSIPPVGIEDVDRALYNLFEERIAMTIVNKGESEKVETLFAGGERFALVKKNRPVRDRNGMLVLPLVSIRRTKVDQKWLNESALGTSTGDLVIKKRLSSTDPEYQNLINKLQLRNQDNVASGDNALGSGDPRGAKSGTVTSRRIQPRSVNTLTGEILAPDLNKNIFEIITMPFPQFYTAYYEITFWAQYVQHMNQMVEKFMSGYDGQGNQFRLDTPKGYWFVGYVGDDFDSGDNFEDYSGEERLVRFSFTMRVPAYIHATRNPGDPVPFRRFLSAPQISFGIFEGTVPEANRPGRPAGSGDLDKFVLDEVELLDKRGDRIDDPRIQTERVRDVIQDPFTGKDIVRFLRVVNRNMRSGETVLSKRVIDHIDDVNL